MSSNGKAAGPATVQPRTSSLAANHLRAGSNIVYPNAGAGPQEERLAFDLLEADAAPGSDMVDRKPVPIRLHPVYGVMAWRRGASFPPDSLGPFCVAIIERHHRRGVRDAGAA